MSNVISIYKHKNFGTGNVDYFNHKEAAPIILKDGKATGNKPDFSDRVTRIKNSLDKVNSLMVELKKIKRSQDERQGKADAE